MSYPLVLDEQETLNRILKGASIARYGDGELNLCIGGRAKAQEYNAQLSARLKEILRSKTDCLVGIPRLRVPEMPERKRQFWARYLEDRFVELYSLRITYASAFITRPDSIPEINTADYFTKFQKTWADRSVVLINGEKPGQRFDEREDFLCNTFSVERWSVPSENAWLGYNELIKRCKKKDPETLFILSVGPTATVLAFDLNQSGYQALDLGHLGMMYKRLYEAN